MEKLRETIIAKLQKMLDANSEDTGMLDVLRRLLETVCYATKE
jgi:hypothetical protein